MQSTGDFVATPAELPASVQHGVHHLQRALAGLLLCSDRDATTVIGVADGPVRQDRDLDVVGVTGHRDE